MADATGPISSLPGSSHAVPEGMTCDECGKPATRRIQGETDSFGCEMHDLCSDCYDKAQRRIHEYEEAHKNDPAVCDWCQKQTTEGDLKETRDFEEGLSGRIYRVCSKCRERVRKELEAEIDCYFDDGD